MADFGYSYVISRPSADLVILKEKLWKRVIIAIPVFFLGCLFASVFFQNDINCFSCDCLVGLIGCLMMPVSLIWLFVRGTIRINGFKKNMIYHAWSYKFLLHPVRVELTKESSVRLTLERGNRGPDYYQVSIRQPGSGTWLIDRTHSADHARALAKMISETIGIEIYSLSVSFPL